MKAKVTIHVGDCLEVLRRLPAESVHCCVTSPPYLGLRRYLPEGHPDADKEIGSEATMEEFVATMVQVFREVRRVMRPDAVAWLNLGDSYNGSGGAGGDYGKGGLREGQPKYPGRDFQALKPMDLCGIPWRVALALQADGWWLRSDVIWQKRSPMPESLNGWRWERHRIKVAPADRNGQPSKAQSPGKPQRSTDANGDFTNGAQWEDCPGCPKCQPNDGLVLRRGSWRPTNSHEYIFQLTKSPDYFCDAEAVKEPATGGAHARGTGVNPKARMDAAGSRQNSSFSGAVNGLVATRNKRSVWTTTSQPLKDAHFAPFPEAIPRTCVKAATSEKGCCPACGSPWARVVERPPQRAPQDYDGKWGAEDRQASGRRMLANVRAARAAGGDHDNPFPTAKTIGWRPTCNCDAGKPVPCTVLDPFFGAGTTGLVAMKMGRHCQGVELNADYAEMARARIAKACGLFGAVEVR